MCENLVSYHFDDGTAFGRTVKTQCGTTDIWGARAQCEDCMEEETKRYPQGWKFHPGDTCPHGNYTGSGHLCGACEDGY